MNNEVNGVNSDVEDEDRDEFDQDDDLAETVVIPESDSTDNVGDASVVLVSPDGFLGTLPFEVIQMEDRSFLIEQRGFVYLRDAVSLVEISKRLSRCASFFTRERMEP